MTLSELPSSRVFFITQADVRLIETTITNFIVHQHIKHAPIKSKCNKKKKNSASNLTVNILVTLLLSAFGESKAERATTSRQVRSTNNNNN